MGGDAGLAGVGATGGAHGCAAVGSRGRVAMDQKTRDGAAKPRTLQLVFDAAAAAPHRANLGVIVLPSDFDGCAGDARTEAPLGEP